MTDKERNSILVNDLALQIIDETIANGGLKNPSEVIIGQHDLIQTLIRKQETVKAGLEQIKKVSSLKG